MPSSLPVGGITEALRLRLFPSVTTWNRLEGRPRTQAFDRALKAEVRDALWMLTKQWQLGEFRGSDAGSPVFAKVRVDTTRADRLPAGRRTGGAVRRMARRWRRRSSGGRVALTSAGSRSARPAARRWAGEWLALVAAIGDVPAGVHRRLPDHRTRPHRPGRRAACADPQVWQLLAAVAGRAMDGGPVDHLAADPGHHAYDGIAGIPPGGHAVDLRRRHAFLAWFARLITAAGRGRRRRLEPAPAGLPVRRLRAASRAAPRRSTRPSEYYQGRLDWYSLDVSRRSGRPRAVPGSGSPRPRPTRTDDDRCRSRSPAWRTPAGGRSRNARRTTATSTPAPPTWPS